MKNQLFFFLVAFVFIYSSCDSTTEVDDPILPSNVLPGYTQEGKNTFGCMLNSKLWLKEEYSTITGNYGHGYLVVSMNRTELKNNDIIMIRTPSNAVFNSGIYNIDSRNIDAYYRKGELFYYTNDSLGGVLEITKLDSINFIVSGKFKFKAINSDNSIVVVDSGRFDLKYIN